MIEVEVHQQLRAFLRESGEPNWSHQLTMARLVARALRLGRSALIQTGAFSESQGRHRLSYLVPILMWQQRAILVAPQAVQQRLLRVEIPRLQQWIGTPKAICAGDRFPNQDFSGLFLTTPQAWLQQQLFGDGFPTGIPTIIDGADALEECTRQILTRSLKSADWEDLMLACPHQADLIRDVRVKLTKACFNHPPNPYECYFLEDAERSLLGELIQQLQQNCVLVLPEAWQAFARQFNESEQLIWVEITRHQGLFSLFCAPTQVAAALAPLWQQQPFVLIGGALDLEASAPTYRALMGLPDLTSVKFSLDRQQDLIHLYLPEGLPLPNTPQFQGAFLREVHRLLNVCQTLEGLTVVLVGDMPLKNQVGSVLAAEYGSRVQVERTNLDPNGILVTGWEFWRHHQEELPTPKVLAIATLPIPSLEHPLVAGRVTAYKRQGLDWFRWYLLPTALNDLQRAIAPLRSRQGLVALFDSRILHRSYGQLFILALSPLARTNYLDEAGLGSLNYSSFLD